MSSADGSRASSKAGKGKTSLLGSDDGKSMASETWGNPGFRGCNFCRRPRSTPNPFLGFFPSKPLLQFRSDRHAECLPCGAKLRKKNAEISTAEQKATYARSLSQNEELYKEHMADLEIVQNAQFEVFQRRKDSGKALSTSDTPEMESERIISLNAESGLEMRKLLGVLWPAALYEKKTGKKLTAASLTKITQNGETLEGVLRPKSEGTPEGTTEIYDVKRSYAANVAKAASTEDALFQEEVSGAWNKVRKVTEVSAQEVVDEAGETLVQLSGGVKKARDDFDDLMDFAPSVSGGWCQ